MQGEGSGGAARAGDGHQHRDHDHPGAPGPLRGAWLPGWPVPAPRACGAGRRGAPRRPGRACPSGFAVLRHVRPGPGRAGPSGSVSDRSNGWAGAGPGRALATFGALAADAGSRATGSASRAPARPAQARLPRGLRAGCRFTARFRRAGLRGHRLPRRGLRRAAGRLHTEGSTPPGTGTAGSRARTPVGPARPRQAPAPRPLKLRFRRDRAGLRHRLRFRLPRHRLHRAAVLPPRPQAPVPRATWFPLPGRRCGSPRAPPAARARPGGVVVIAAAEMKSVNDPLLYSRAGRSRGDRYGLPRLILAAETPRRSHRNVHRPGWHDPGSSGP